MYRLSVNTKEQNKFYKFDYRRYMWELKSLKEITMNSYASQHAPIMARPQTCKTYTFKSLADIMTEKFKRKKKAVQLKEEAKNSKTLPIKAIASVRNPSMRETKRQKPVLEFKLTQFSEISSLSKKDERSQKFRPYKFDEEYKRPIYNRGEYKRVRTDKNYQKQRTTDQKDENLGQWQTNYEDNISFLMK